MQNNDFVVFGYYRTRQEAQTAVDSLDKDGFEPEDISVLTVGGVMLVVHTRNSAWRDMAELALESTHADSISVIENPEKNWRLAPLRHRLNLVYAKPESVQKD